MTTPDAPAWYPATVGTHYAGVPLPRVRVRVYQFPGHVDVTIPRRQGRQIVDPRVHVSTRNAAWSLSRKDGATTLRAIRRTQRERSGS